MDYNTRRETHNKTKDELLINPTKTWPKTPSQTGQTTLIAGRTPTW
uniref:Uncharacterized protein n=1 Tax=Arundo donax TaxID=35708 RepID=A0A0A9BCU9_ARUDO